MQETAPRAIFQPPGGALLQRLERVGQRRLSLARATAPLNPKPVLDWYDTYLGPVGN